MFETLLTKLRFAFSNNAQKAEPQDNRGLVEEPPTPTDYILGGEQEAAKPVMQSDRDWSDYLPAIELQNRGFETWGCVSFSRNNCLEIMFRKLWETNADFSDRFMATVSNTRIGVGNGFQQVAQAGREKGSVPESVYPWGGKNVQEYYQRVPAEILAEGEKSLYEYEFQYEWVDWAGCDPEKLWEGLQYSPLQVSVFAWPWKKDGIYQRATTTPNHAVTLFKGEYKKYWYIFDHYEATIKKLAWNFYFGSAMRHVVKKKRMLELLKGNKQPSVYAIDAKQVAHHILDEAQFTAGQEAGLWGGFDDVREISQTKMDSYSKGEPIVFAVKK